MFLPCLESLPQSPSSRAGPPLQHLRGGGPAWSADRKRKGPVAGGGALRVRCTRGDSWEGPQVPQTLMKPLPRSTLPLPLQKTPRLLAWAPRGIRISHSHCVLSIARWPDLQALSHGCWSVLVKTPWALSRSLHLLSPVTWEF